MKRQAIALVLLLGACSSAPHGEPGTEPLPAPPPGGEPAGYVGLSGPQLAAMMGQAAFSRRENGSELWRYDNPACRAFFFLYAEGGVMRVRHVETVPRGTSMAADLGCLNVLRAKPASPVS